MKELKIINKNIDEIKEYENNAKEVDWLEYKVGDNNC
nr:MAG TPA: hypothetical protein [Caudoviricetes sp.]